MPRPKSEITGYKTISFRMTPAQKEMFKAMGGIQWLRNYLNRQIRNEEIQLGLSPQSSLTQSQKESSARN
jgi:hypothetical protein